MLKLCSGIQSFVKGAAHVFAGNISTVFRKTPAKKNSSVIIHFTGKIADDLYMLGTPYMPIYLLDAERPAIFDAGLAFLGNLYVEAIKGVLGDRQPAYCCLTHSHFDHCGAVSVLKSHFPELKVVASEKAKKIFGRPNAIKLMRSLTRSAKNAVNSLGMVLERYDDFEPFDVDMVVKEGDRLQLSDSLTFRVLETPGHTWDSISYYAPQRKLLIASEAVGIPDRPGTIVPSFLVDYQIYLNSMIKLDKLDLETLCIGHRFAYTADDARTYIPQAIDHCRNFFNQVKGFILDEDGNVEKVMKRIKKIEYDDIKGPKQPEEPYLINLEAKINAIKKHLENLA